MNYYKELRKELVKQEFSRKARDYANNRTDLNTYYRVGKILTEAGKHYGEGIIKDYSIKLTSELGKGYTFTALTRMKKFFILQEKLATVSQQLTYGHYVEVLPLNNIDEIKYYLMISEQQNLSIRELRKRIKSKEYEITLRCMRQLYRIFNNEIWKPLVSKLTWNYCSDRRILSREYSIEK